MRTVPSTLFTTDWDKEAGLNLSEEQLIVYERLTAPVRKKWEGCKAAYNRGRRVYNNRGWSYGESETAAHYMEYRQTLWSMYMSVRIGPRSAI